MDQRVTVVARFKAKDGFEQKLKEQLLTNIEPSRADDGCIKYELHQGVDDPSRFLFYEIWESKELLEKHSVTAHVQNSRSKIKEFVAEKPEVILLTKVADV